jgi:ribosome-associated toxin RatA of RatAB toxin-antitoxin module
MPHVQATTSVQASPEEIFDFLSEYHNIPLIQPQFESASLVSEQDRGLGAVVELKGHFHGIPITVRSRIVTFNPPYRLVSISEGTVLSRNTWELHLGANTDHPTTEVRFRVEYKMTGALGVLSGLFHHEIQSMTDSSLHRLHDIFSRPKDL